jgi:hypothetical protein
MLNEVQHDEDQVPQFGGAQLGPDKRPEPQQAG